MESAIGDSARRHEEETSQFDPRHPEDGATYRRLSSGSYDNIATPTPQRAERVNAHVHGRLYFQTGDGDG